MVPTSSGEVLIDSYSHADNVNQRMNFLSFLMSQAPYFYKLPIQHLRRLWALLYESPLTSNDSQALFKFLSEIAADLFAVPSSFDHPFLVSKEF